MFRFRSGQVHLRRFRVAEATEIVPGMLVCLDADRLVPASSLPTAAAVAAQFAGVAHQRSEAGQTEPVSVDVSPLAVYEGAVEPSAFEIGELLAASVDVAPSDDTLAAAAGPDEAIAMAAEFADAGRTRLRVTFASTVCTASSHQLAQLG